MQKPLETQNADLIDELTTAISAITGTEEMIARSAREGMRQIHKNLIAERRKRIFKKSKVAACVCALFFLTSNVLSYAAYGMNAISATVTYMEKGVILDYNQDKETDRISTNAGNPYAQRMRYICEEYGYEALVPTYLPEGFEPNPDIEFGHRSISDDPLIITFNFSNTHKHLFRRRDTIVLNIVTPQTK